MPTRYWLVFGMFLLSVLLYVDRVCMSSAKESIAGDLKLTDTQMGWVLSIFALGYAIFQVPSGLLADRFGPRFILSAVVTVWSGFTALTAAAQGFVSMLAMSVPLRRGRGGRVPGMRAGGVFLDTDVRARAGPGGDVFRSAVRGGLHAAGGGLDGQPAGLAPQLCHSGGSRCRMGGLLVPVVSG